MKRLYSLFLGILLLINFNCQNESAKNLEITKDVPKKNLEIIKRNVPLEQSDDIKDIVKKNENFIKLIESFKPKTYSIDELIDLTTKDLKIFNSIRARHFKSKADTAAVKSRLLLVEINLKRLNFLLNKDKINTDTIQKTFNEIVLNLNRVVQKIRLYSNAPDEFESILAHDSMAQIKRDSLFNIKKIKDSLEIRQH